RSRRATRRPHRARRRVRRWRCPLRAPFSRDEHTIGVNVLLSFAAALVSLRLAGLLARAGRLAWAGGVLAFAVAAGTMAWGAAHGWDARAFRLWYLAGAFLSAPLLGPGSLQRRGRLRADADGSRRGGGVLRARSRAALRLGAHLTGVDELGEQRAVVLKARAHLFGAGLAPFVRDDDAVTRAVVLDDVGMVDRQIG